jgi:colicin import membrane protein
MHKYFVPKTFILNRDDGTRRVFAAGPLDMDEADPDLTHWMFEANVKDFDSVVENKDVPGGVEVKADAAAVVAAAHPITHSDAYLKELAEREQALAQAAPTAEVDAKKAEEERLRLATIGAMANAPTLAQIKAASAAGGVMPTWPDLPQNPGESPADYKVRNDANKKRLSDNWTADTKAKADAVAKAKDDAAAKAKADADAAAKAKTDK